MYITSAARPRFDIMYNINKLRIVHNRRLHDNSWLMTLPIWCELDSWHAPHLQKQGTPSKRNRSSQWLPHFLPHHKPFMLMPSKLGYNASNFENVINTTIIRFYRDFTTTHNYYIQHEYCRLLADGKGIFHMECHYNFITVLGRPWSSHPLVELQNMFTPYFSIHLQVTPYASNLMKHCLDILS